MSSERPAYLSAVLLALFLGACTTPAQVRLLAERTAANASFLSTQLKELASSNQRFAALRADNVARINEGVRAARVRLELDRALIDQSEDQVSKKLLKKLTDWAKKVKEILKPLAQTRAEEAQAILAGQTEIDTKSEDLANVAKALAKLSEKDDLVSISV